MVEADLQALGLIADGGELSTALDNAIIRKSLVNAMI